MFQHYFFDDYITIGNTRDRNYDYSLYSSSRKNFFFKILSDFFFTKRNVTLVLSSTLLEVKVKFLPSWFNRQRYPHALTGLLIFFLPYLSTALLTYISEDTYI